MLRNGYPQLYPPHDWVRQTESELPTTAGLVVIAQWVSDRRHTITIYQHSRPERERKRFSVVWEPPDDAPTRTIWGSSVAVTEAHVRRMFERAHAPRRE